MCKQKQTSTIFTRIVVPLLLTAIIQSALMVGMMVYNGVFRQLRENALSILDERAQSKHQSLEMEMTVNWSFLANTEEKLLETVQTVLDTQGERFDAIATDAKLNAELIQAMIPELVSRMRVNNTTGIFVVLNGLGVAGHPDTFAGAYIRDTDPTSDAADNSDLHILRGLPPLSRELGYSLDSFWQASFTFPGGEGNPDNDYFYQPLNSAKLGLLTESLHDGYWSLPFAMNGDEGGAVITYTEPLLNRDGVPYGVIGVEVSESYVISILNKGEFSRSNRGCYFLGVTMDGGKSYRRACTGGAVYKQFFRAEDQILTPFVLDENDRISVRSTKTGDVLRGTVLPLKLYPRNMVFSPQRWVLIGLEAETTLFAFVDTVRTLFVFGAILAAAVGVIVAVLTGRGIVRPIVRLVGCLQKSDPSEELSLPQTRIAEVDHLAQAIMLQHHDVIEAATRLTGIIKLAGLPVGVFEVKEESDVAYCSDGVFTLLCREDLRRKNNLLSKAVCMSMLADAMKNPVEDSIYRLTMPQAERFVRIKQMQEGHSTVGVILDVTLEVEERRRVERERDHDPLTGILSRRAFESDAEALFFKHGSMLGVAAVIMLDLDNLKYLNDTYGHDCGDGYIRAFADALRLFGTDRAIVARRSGDEFYVLLYGGKSKEELRDHIGLVWNGILARNFTLPDGIPYKMRVSAGVAWYPDDARDLSQLVHYADFAMYRVKRNAKGTLEEFRLQDYREDTFLVSGRDALERMIDRQLVRFAVQPILSARTGDVFGYELLMRTGVRELPDPLTVLRLADAEGKLYNIERLTWYKGLETVRLMLTNRCTPSGAFFFLNSIVNQVLTDEDELALSDRYGCILSRMVLEVTESEKHDATHARQKMAFIRGHGGKVAIDDYSMGCNNETAMMQMDADIVKLDMSYVRGVDADLDKQALIRNLISCARQRGVAVLAERVETREEMRTLIRLGVDFLQGFYLGLPQYQPMNTDKLLKREIRRIVMEMDYSDE